MTGAAGQTDLCCELFGGVSDVAEVASGVWDYESSTKSKNVSTSSKMITHR